MNWSMLFSSFPSSRNPKDVDDQFLASPVIPFLTSATRRYVIPRMSCHFLPLFIRQILISMYRSAIYTLIRVVIRYYCTTIMQHFFLQLRLCETLSSFRDDRYTRITEFQTRLSLNTFLAFLCLGFSLCLFCS
jgi:hypothetical protein